MAGSSLSKLDYYLVILYLWTCTLSDVVSLNFGCYNQSQMEMSTDDFVRNTLSYVSQQDCYNRSTFDSVVAFNFYYENGICERFYNYSSTYRVNSNNASQMCVLQLPDSQKASVMSCRIRDSVWNPNAITVAGLQGELDRPYAVLVSNNSSSMFIADTYHDRILEYDLNLKTYIRTYDHISTGRTVNVPIAMALADDESELLAANYPHKTVFRWSLLTNTSSLVVASYYSATVGVALGRNKIVYFAQQLSNHLQSRVPNADPYWGFGDWRLDNISGAKHMVIVNDFLYIAQSQLCRIVKVSLTDENKTVITVAGTGRVGSSSDRLRFPWGVAVDPLEGHIFVSDSKNHRIQLWLVNATEGITIGGMTARPGSSANQLNLPRGLALGHDRSVFVADTSNGRIQKFQRYCLTQ